MSLSADPPPSSSSGASLPASAPPFHNVNRALNIQPPEPDMYVWSGQASALKSEVFDVVYMM